MRNIILFAIAGSLSACVVHAALIREPFATDPALAGWRVFGDAKLFQWDSARENLAVTWDSAQTNSYFYLPLGATFTEADGFCVQFDLNLSDTAATGYFQVALGLCNLADATSTNFSRANGVSPNLFEFDYFPEGPDSYGPSLNATLVDSTDNFYFAYDDTQPLATGMTYRVLLIHRPGERSVSGMVYLDGRIFTCLPKIAAYAANHFNLDTLAVCNYTTVDDSYGDALLAHGTVDNLAFASPLPVDHIVSPAAGQVQFTSDTNWLYTLEQSADFKTWSPAAPAVFGSGTNLILQASNPSTTGAVYRVRAELP